MLGATAHISRHCYDDDCGISRCFEHDGVNMFLDSNILDISKDYVIVAERSRVSYPPWPTTCNSNYHTNVLN